MRILFLAFLLAAASGENCNGIYINQTYFDVEIVKEDMKNIKSLVYNVKDKTAYFISEDPETTTKTLGYINMDNKSTGVINTVPNVTSVSVDNIRNRLYVGSAEGVYIINMTTLDKIPEKVQIINDSIISVFVRKGTVYYINDKKDGFKYDFGAPFVNYIIELKNLPVERIIRDDNFNYHYLDASKKLRKSKVTTAFQFEFKDKLVNDIVVNTKFRAYICAEDGFYAYTRFSYEYEAEKISDLVADKMAFLNEEEPIYIANNTLYKLTKNPDSCKLDS